MKRAIWFLALGLTAPSQCQEAPSLTAPRTWNFEQNGKLESDSGSLSFKTGGRIDAHFVRMVDTNRVLLKPIDSTTIYWTSISNFCAKDRSFLLQAAAMRRKSDESAGKLPVSPSGIEGVRQTLVLSNSSAFYDWDQAKPGVAGTLTVESFEPRIKLIIRNCRFDPDQWQTNTELSKTSDAVFTRICPRTNITINAWCISERTVHPANGKIELVEKIYDCSGR